MQIIDKMAKACRGVCLKPTQGESQHLPGLPPPNTFGHKNVIFITKTEFNRKGWIKPWQQECLISRFCWLIR